jgi:RNA polymerase sigma factor (sigma-70 family)
MDRSSIACEERAQRELVQMLTAVIRSQALAALRRRRSFSSGRDAAQELPDLCQSVLLSLLDRKAGALGRWDPARGASFPHFVRVVVAREIASILRSRSRSPWGEEPMEPDLLQGLAGPSAELEREVSARQLLGVLLERARARLDPRGAEMLEWLCVEELSTEHVCGRTGLSPDAVHAWRSRLRGLLRAMAVEMEETASREELVRSGRVDA